MGCVGTISHTTFPKQGTHLNRHTRVLFRYHGPELMGTIVRDDMESPWRTIIRLDDGRFVLADECQYAPVLEGEKP